MKIPVWVKFLSTILVISCIIAGLLIDVPRLDILNESIRNLFFHVTSWFAMVFLFLLSFIYSIRHLSTQNLMHDKLAQTFTEVGIIFGIVGLATGMLWAKYTWGAFWVTDPKLNGAAVSMLAYLAYVVLRNSLSDPVTKGRISGVYNILAFVLMLIFIFIIPRMTSSLHPGNGGNPAFSNYDLDSTMRWVFYPAVVGWIILGLWVSEIKFRIEQYKSTMA